jgi:multidrug efflux pump subunit AcrB
MGGFLPLLLFVGGDFWPPLAVVLALGVAGSSVLAVVFVPVVYRWIVLAGRPAEVEASGPAWVEAPAGGAS